MKRLILVLTVTFLFVAGSAFSATVNCIMYSVENDGEYGGLEQSETQSPDTNAINPQFESPPPDEAGVAGHPIISDYYFTIETDDATGDVISFTDLFGSNFLTHEFGGWDTEDGASFDASEQVYKNGVTYNVADIAYDGYAAYGGVVPEAGHGIWYRHRRLPYYHNQGTLVFDCGIIGINFDGTDGEVLFGPIPELTESYVFHAVPIPAAGWLLGSGLIGLAGYRRKVRKEA